jgi:hypothetical protein
VKRFRLFCLCCKWTVTLGLDDALWHNPGTCPACRGPIDAVELK